MKPAGLLRFAVVSLALLGAGCWTSSAQAQNKKACGKAYEGAQESRRKGELVGAREQLLVCANEGCPAFIRDECIGWLDEVKAAVPSFVVVAKDAEGNDLSEVKLTIDGKLHAETLGARGIEVDPGEHALMLEHDGEKIERTVMLREGERNRQVEVRFGGAEGPGGESTARRAGPGAGVGADSSKASRPMLAYVLGGVGVLGLGAFAYFALDGSGKRSDLETDCKPNCTQKQIDEVDRSFLFADISLGVSVLSLGAATYLLLSGDGGAEDTARRDPLPGFRLTPTSGGAYGAWRTTF